MGKRLHKAFVDTTDDSWRSFRALCLTKGETVQTYLGYLVDNEVKKDKANKMRAAKRRPKADETVRKAGVKV